MILGGAICEESDCTVFFVIALVALSILAVFALSFIWGMWYGMYYRRRRAGASRLSAHVVAGLSALLPAALIVGPGIGLLGEPLVAAAAITGAVASLVWGIRTWRDNRPERKRQG